MLLLPNFNVSEKMVKQFSSKANFYPFCNLIALTLGQNSGKDLRVTNIIKGIKFNQRRLSIDNRSQGIWD